ncbi:FIG4 [Cordylochernes scorpioides]|uniref:FIG4 n=1 Tax=Cordylochernes scorpioides TaxID=51811 RepID=A0ABY6LA32_9ARAC|nr:FIG4 [Cordylochernes scorpioides]
MPPSEGSHVQVHPLFRTMQKMALYETKTRFYIIGSNNTQTKFRVLKIDRTEPHELVVVDDQIEYSSKQMKDMLNTIHAGNKNTSLKSTGTGFVRIVSAFGIVDGSLRHTCDRHTLGMEADAEEPGLHAERDSERWREDGPIEAGATRRHKIITYEEDNK